MRKPWSGIAVWGLATAGSVLAFYLFVLKLLIKLSGGRGAPCPASLAMLVDNPLRRRSVARILERADLRTGETVLEVGPGPGAFTVEAARRLGPTGKLIAVDIQPKMIAMVVAKIHAAELHNVETHVGDAYALPLDDVAIDRAFMVAVLPEIPDHVRALREVHRVLKPDGVLSISEQFLDPDYPRRASTLRWAAEAGFTLAESHGNLWEYTLNFRKIEDIRSDARSEST